MRSSIAFAKRLKREEDCITLLLLCHLVLTVLRPIIVSTHLCYSLRAGCKASSLRLSPGFEVQVARYSVAPSLVRLKSAMLVQSMLNGRCMTGGLRLTQEQKSLEKGDVLGGHSCVSHS